MGPPEQERQTGGCELSDVVVGTELCFLHGQQQVLIRLYSPIDTSHLNHHIPPRLMENDNAKCIQFNFKRSHLLTVPTLF